MICSVIRREVELAGFRDERRRFVVADSASRASIVRLAKKSHGLDGLRADTVDRGDLIEIRPIGIHETLLVTFEKGDEL